MIINNTHSLWKEAFRNGFEHKYINLVINSYKDIEKEKRTELLVENTRRNILCNQMRKNKHRYGITFNIVTECGVWDKKSFEDEGRIDICCYLSELEDQYFAFECKRFLKVDLIPSYIKNKYYAEGIKRFEDNIYSQDINIGGMVAFLEEGDYTRLNNLMINELPKFSVDKKIDILSEKYNYNYVYETTHYRKNNKNIKLIHVLMDFS